jgi:lysophospholipase L1-like esterase
MKRHHFFTVAGVVLIAAFLEFVGAVILYTYPAVQKSREQLQGKHLAETAVNATPQAYLLYIPTPLFNANGFQQNNADGYRGEAIPLQRSPDSFRVLFLGGSTTYGEGVKNPVDTYPAQLGELLKNDSQLSAKKIEIINAGLRWGTTAEILTHYLLKFRYYKPDLVVINPGGNDPVAYTKMPYEPDYSNWRKTPQAITALHKQARLLLHSRFASTIIVFLFFPDIAEGTTFIHDGENAPAQWFHPRESTSLHIDELAFYNNLSTVTREILQDGAQVFLLSYQGNPFDSGDQEAWGSYYDYEESVLQQIGRELQVPFAPFPLSRIPEELWVDPSHINEEGERRKALYVYENIKPMLADWTKSSHATSSSHQHTAFPTLAIPDFAAPTP